MGKQHDEIVNILKGYLTEKKFIVKTEHNLWYMDRYDRVDLVGYSKGQIWTFEIKTYREDLFAYTGHNHCGNYNYIVVPHGLFDSAIEYIEENAPYVGVLEKSGNDFEEKKKASYMRIYDTWFANIYYRIRTKEVTKKAVSETMGISRITLDKWIKDFDDLISTIAKEEEYEVI